MLYVSDVDEKRGLLRNKFWWDNEKVVLIKFDKGFIILNIFFVGVISVNCKNYILILIVLGLLIGGVYLENLKKGFY